MPLTPNQLIDKLFGPPPSTGSKKLSDFKKKNIPKPEKPKTLEHSELFEILDLEKQYEERTNSLISTNTVEKLKSGEYGIIGIDGKEYPIPTIDQIKERIMAKEEILKTKTEQGLTKIILTPFAMPVAKLAEKYKETILKHHQAGTLASTNGDQLELDENDPLFVWDQYQDDANISYFPTQYDQAGHNGQTKEELINSDALVNGWQIILVEENIDIPAQGDIQAISNRERPQANKKPKEYLNLLQTDPQYEHEQGLTPEDWLTLAITTLEETNQVIDDYRGQGRANYNLAGYFPASRKVSIGFWGRDVQQAILSRGDAGNRGSSGGARFSVRI